MSQITALYTSKEQEQIVIIEELRKKVEELHTVRSHDKETESGLVVELSRNKEQIEKFRKQN